MSLHRTPLRSKRPAPRRYRTPRCDVRGCNKKMEIITGDAGAPKWINTPTGYCKSHAKAEADRRFAAFVRQRDGRCMIPTDKPCAGPLQACHLLSRRFMGTRWDERNCLAGCRSHHAFWTANPDRWAAHLDEVPDLLHKLRMAAFYGSPMDMAEVLARYPA